MIARLLQCLLCALTLVSASSNAAGVVAGKSEIAFTMRAMGVNFDGRFRKWTADIAFQPDALERSKAQIDVDLSSIDLASAESEVEARGPSWFNAVKFPVAHFTSASIRSLGGDRYEIAGKLSLKGITRDCLVPILVKADAAGNRVAEGTFVLKRMDYKIGEGEWADTSTVENDIRVHFRMLLEPSARAALDNMNPGPWAGARMSRASAAASSGSIL